MFEGIWQALQDLLTWEGIVAAVGGTLLGTVVAIIPGLGTVMAMALVLPLTFGMDRANAMILLVTVMGASGFAGSMTAILLNVPGTAVNAATCLDGYPLARQGKAGFAIGASSAASGLGALFGIAALVVALPVVRSLILTFGPPEFFALTVMGVAMIASVSVRSPLKGAISGLVGMMLGLVGTSQLTPFPRYTFGVLELADGFRLVPALIGLFAITEVFDLARRDQPISQVAVAEKGGVWKGVQAVLRRPLLLLRSSLIGTGIGVLPGVGAAVATWVAYFAAQRGSKDPDSFGKGNIEGVIGPEAAIDAKEGGSMLPVLAFGIPASITTAILLSAFLIHGIQPGQRLLTNEMPLIWVMILALIFSNVSTSLLGLALANQMVKVTLIPIVRIAPIILIMAMLGAYADRQSMFGVWILIAFGVLGIFLRRYGFPVAPLIVGMILLPLAERYFHLSVQINRGSYDFLIQPLPAIIFGLTVVAVSLPWLRRRAMRRRARRVVLSDAAPVRAANAIEDEREASWGEVFFILLVFGAAMVLLFDTSQYVEEARLFPRIMLPPLIALLGFAAFRTWRHINQQQDAVSSTEDKGSQSTWRVSLWMAASPALMYILGVEVGLGFYLTLFWLVRTPRHLRGVVTAVVGGFGVSFFVYLVSAVLGLRLFSGLLEIELFQKLLG